MRSVTLMRCASLLIAAAVVLPPLAAQTAPSPSEQQRRGRQEAHKGDFDYLLGDWRFSATRHLPDGDQQFGGRWSAVRLEGDGQVLDEYRVIGDSGQTWYVSYTTRAYNAAADRWELVSIDGIDGLQNVGTAHKVGKEMHIEQTFGATSDQPSRWRIRYYDIQPDRFAWTADRSVDGGKTWTSPFMRIDARRVGPPRNLTPLTPARTASRE